MMGWWVPNPELASDEKVVWQRAANREQSGYRQVGGRLLRTDRRLLFQPNRLDAMLRGKIWNCDFADITDVGEQQRQLAAPVLGRTARNRRRLKVTLRNGSSELFVVNNVSGAIDELQRAVGGGPM
jgi:hypothetical protein